jgi:hypothetical protein
MSEHTVYWFKPRHRAVDLDTLEERLSPAAVQVMRGRTHAADSSLVAVRLFGAARPELVRWIADACGYELAGEESRAWGGGKPIIW